MVEPLENNQDDILEKAVQQFVDAQLQGQKPEIDEFVKQYPELEQQIRERIRKLQEIDGLFSPNFNLKRNIFIRSITPHGVSDSLNICEVYYLIKPLLCQSLLR